jgi:tetratricopeptide (TPR) repeat protein
MRASGDTAGAINTLRAAFERLRAPALGLALGEMLSQRGEDEAALRVYHDTLAIDATLPGAHIALAAIHERADRRAEARTEIATAIAYHPASRKALEIADRITGGHASKSERVQPFSIFLDVDSIGAVHVAWPAGGDAERYYAGCRAILRYEPDLRATLFGEPPGTPYYLSMAEEMICLEAAIGGYVVSRMEDRDRNPFDPHMDSLLHLAYEDGLAGYAMVEILGRFRPERARTAPPDVHRAMVRYVERVVLGESLFDDPPNGLFVATR